MDAHIDDGHDLVIQVFLRQLEVGNGVTHKAAQLFFGFKKGDCMTLLAKIVCCRKTGRATADNGDIVACCRCQGLRNRITAFCIIHYEALQVVDGYGLVHQDSAAAGLTKTGANPADDAGQGIFFLDQSQGRSILAFGNEIHISLYIDPAGTGKITRGLAVAIVVRCQLLETFFPVGFELRSSGHHHHPFCNLRLTGSGPLAIYIYKTQKTGPLRVLSPRQVTEMGNVNPHTGSRLQNSCAQRSNNALSVNSKRYRHLLSSMSGVFHFNASLSLDTSNSRNSSSLRIGIPSSTAFCSLDPEPSPTTT